MAAPAAPRTAAGPDCPGPGALLQVAPLALPLLMHPRPLPLGPQRTAPWSLQEQNSTQQVFSIEVPAPRSAA